MPNPIKTRLAAGDKLLAAWLFSGSCDIAELLARAGYPVVLICYEHGPGGIAELGDLLRAVRVGGAEPLLRVPSHDPNLLKRVLDGGARSLMIPMVETAEEAQAIVAACRYPPLGRRGYAAGVIRASRFGFTADYGKRAHEELFLALQIESPKGVANAEAIARVDGVDMLFIGPNDLAGALGHFENAADRAVLTAIDEIVAAAKRAGKHLAIVPHAGRDATACAEMGFALVAGAADIALLREGAKADIAQHAKAYGL